MSSFFASSCLLCHALGNAPVCTGCLKDIQTCYCNVSSVCPCCAQWSANGAVCDRCSLFPPLYEKLWACATYRAPLRSVLHEWKHIRRSEFGHIFAILLRENPPPWLPESQIDMILPMPMSRERRMARGFNQCDELADVITHDYKIPDLSPKSVFRQHKPPQSTLNAQQRAQNIEGVFDVRCDVKNRKVLIIDDVMTTGATLTELARVLRQSGATAVYACVVLRNL